MKKGGTGPDIYIEVLVGSRIHPEHYSWARKMAVDALCGDDDEVSCKFQSNYKTPLLKILQIKSMSLGRSKRS